MGLAAAESGSIRLDGEELVGASAARRRQLSSRVQIIFQDPYGSLNPVRTIGSTLAEPLSLAHGVGRREAAGACARPSSAWGCRRPLPTATRRNSPAVSAAIAIARAIVLGPELIVCDEPVSALDLTIRSRC